MEYTIEELREMAELTSVIAANLKTIEDCRFTESDLSEMMLTTNKVARNLDYIAENADDDEIVTMLETTNAVVANLQAMG